jgi:Transposase DDE domain
MVSVSRALGRIKSDLHPYLPDEAIEGACRDAGHAWRERKLGPVATVHLFVLQVLSFNTAMTHVRHLAGQALTAGAYCRARARLPLEVLQRLLRDSSTAMRAGTRAATAGVGSRAGTGLWRGLRAYLVDGSSTITPDVPQLQKAFGQPKGCKPGCGFPVPKLLGLFDAFSGLLVEMLALPLYTHEQSKVWRLHPLLTPGDLLVGDCGFCSFAHLAMLWSRGVYACFRIHQRQIVDFRPHRRHRGRLPKAKRKGRPTSVFVRRLGRHDHVVRWQKQIRPKWMSDEQWDALPESLEVRELRYSIPRRGQRTLCVTVATTLLDPKLFPKDDLAELYYTRWRVETHFAQLKTTLKMRKLKSRTEDGVRKELAAYGLVYNLVHALMMEAARRQGETPDRISFIDTVRWLLSAAPGDELPTLLVNPLRPNRHEPRVVKDREDTYTKMTRPRAELRKALKNKEIAA